MSETATRLSSTQLDALRRLADPGSFYSPTLATGQALARRGLVTARHYPHNHAMCNGRKGCQRNPGVEWGYTVTDAGHALLEATR